MSNQNTKESLVEKERRLPDRQAGILPFLIEFVKFSAGFASIIALALVGLHLASVAMTP